MQYDIVSSTPVVNFFVKTVCPTWEFPVPEDDKSPIRTFKVDLCTINFRATYIPDFSILYVEWNATGAKFQNLSKLSSIFPSLPLQNIRSFDSVKVPDDEKYTLLIENYPDALLRAVKDWEGVVARVKIAVDDQIAKYGAVP